MTTYYVKSSGSDGNTGLSDAQAWATPEYAESVLRNTSSAHKVLLRCGDTFVLSTGLRPSIGGNSKINCGEFGSYYMSGGVETEGVSGTKPHIRRDFDGLMVADGPFTSGRYYIPPFGSMNKFMYLAGGDGTFPSTFPTLPTTNGATVSIGGVTFTARPIDGSSGYFQTSGVIDRNSGDTANYIRFRNLKIGGSRGYGFVNNINTTTPSLTYFELIDCDFDTCLSAAWFTSRNNNQNVEWVIDGAYVRYCGMGAKASNHNNTNGGVRPGYAYFRGAATTTGLTREFKNSIITRCWQECLIQCPQVSISNVIIHAFYVGLYFNADEGTNVTGCTADKVMLLGTADTNHHRYTGYCGYALMFGNERTTSGAISDNQVTNVVTAFTGGAIYIASRSINNKSNFDNTTVAFLTSVDDRLPITANSPTGHTNGAIKNCAFIQKTLGLGSYTGNAFSGITADYNYWSTEAIAGNAAGAHDVFGDVDGLADIYKQDGWQNIVEYTDVNLASFQPSDASTLFDAGTPITGITLDIDGNTRGNPPTIGAWEIAYDDPGGGGGGTPTIPSIYVNDTKYSQGAAGTGRTVPKPLNLADGDLVILELEATVSSSAGVTNFANVSGFTYIIRSQGTGSATRPEAACYYKKITDAASEPDNYTFDSTQPWIAHTHRVNGHDATTPIGQTSVVNSEGTGVTSQVIPSITTAEDNVLLFACVAQRDGSPTAQDATPMTEIYEVIPSGGTRGSSAHYELRASAGATGTRTISWTNSTRAAALMFEILPGESSADITPPVNTVPAYVSTVTDDGATFTFTLTDDTPADIRADVVVHPTSTPRPSVAQVFSHDDGNGDDATDYDSKTNVASGVSNTLSVTGLTEPKYHYAFAAQDDEGNIQLQPVTGTFRKEPPSGYKYEDVTIDGGAVPGSVLFGLNYSAGDVTIYPETTSPSGLPLSIDGAGNITITRGGNTSPQTFNVQHWSLASGVVSDVTYSDPFYQALIGPFENNTGTPLSDITVYVVAGMEDAQGRREVPAHDQYTITDYVDSGVAVPVNLDSDGFGYFKRREPGTYYGDVYTADGSHHSKLGVNQVIGVVVA